MAGCEKCWRLAGLRSMSGPAEKTKTDHYHDILEETKDTPCTPKEQAGDWWDEELKKDTRF